MNPAMLMVTAGIALFSGIFSYESAKNKAQTQEDESAVAQYNAKLKRYWQVSDFNAISGIKTSAQQPKGGAKLRNQLSGDLLANSDTYATNTDRGYISLSSTGQVVGGGTELPIDTDSIAQASTGQAISTGLTLYSAYSSYNASKA